MTYTFIRVASSVVVKQKNSESTGDVTADPGNASRDQGGGIHLAAGEEELLTAIVPPCVDLTAV
jgi:hypothetical protein